MKKIILSSLLGVITLFSFGQTILVKDLYELDAAGKKAKPGDMIVLKNGEWKNVIIKLIANGSKEQPITYKAQSPGKVFISGQSRLAIGGNFLVIDGLNFRNGYSGKNAVIEFHSGKDEIANDCRVTNCSIDNFNNPKRLDENYWIAFYGKRNRLDHCSFRDKKNVGVLLAVIMDDERNRESFHHIDHNYFGKRIPLASNGGEIIRVGVSEHCQFYSNTQITDNFFEHCDGETEIISIKSCGNVVKNNLFKECQGGLVLRHGNYNTVENNIFLGNDKAGTGGVRVINKGQWIVNNFFYRCRGVDFRSPLSIMNGIPNSPANRYVQVTDAVIANNTFMECSPISFCEGSDAERTLPPQNVLMLGNVFYNTKDSVIYHVFDNVSGIEFVQNELNTNSRGSLNFNSHLRFKLRNQKLEKERSVILPLSKESISIRDSLQKISSERLGHALSTKPGFTDLDLLKRIENNAYQSTGVAWFDKKEITTIGKVQTAYCADSKQLYAAIASSSPVDIYLIAGNYVLTDPLVIKKTVSLHSANKKIISFTTENIPSVFVIEGNGNLVLNNLKLDGKNIKAAHFIASTTSGSSDHYNLSIIHSTINNLDRRNGCETFFSAYKSIVADSIIIRNSSFGDLHADFFAMNDEKDDKGYYNAEQVIIENNNFNTINGVILNIYRGGNDESTMGPKLVFQKNKLMAVNSGQTPLISLAGVQVSGMSFNSFTNCNTTGILVKYSDKVRARHHFSANQTINSGRVDKDQFVMEE